MGREMRILLNESKKVQRENKSSSGEDWIKEFKVRENTNIVTSLLPLPGLTTHHTTCHVIN
jgi:hypothetical protein